jgi:hypothetical protein
VSDSVDRLSMSVALAGAQLDFAMNVALEVLLVAGQHVLLVRIREPERSMRDLRRRRHW